MKQYLALLENILKNGETRQDRTGVGTKSIFGVQLKFDLTEGFPIVTVRKTNFNAAVWELAWMLGGHTNVKWLNDRGVKIWDAWADENGELGKIYSKQWTDWNGINQIKQVINNIRVNPYSRRHLVSAWNVGELEEMNLVPCHFAFQFYVREDKYLDLSFAMRSSDSVIGLPFNLVEYALLCHLVAKECGYIAGKLIYNGADCHIYSNHIEAVEVMLEREPYPLPQLELTCGIDDLTPDGAKLVGYKYHPFIKLAVAV